MNDALRGESASGLDVVAVSELVGVSATEAFACELGRDVARCGGGCVVWLSGELGAGKTSFVRGFVRGLGHAEGGVSSPTFAVGHRYECAGCVGVVHVDAYRLGGDEEAGALLADLGVTLASRASGLGVGTATAGGDDVVVVEWPERLPEGVGMVPDLVVRLWHAGADRRGVEVRRRRAG